MQSHNKWINPGHICIFILFLYGKCYAVQVAQKVLTTVIFSIFLNLR